VRVGPAEVRGSLAAPPSKSVTIRAFVAAALASGESTILRPARCLDTDAAVAALGALGARLVRRDDTMRVRGFEGPPGHDLPCGESALCMRMLAPVAASLCDREVTLHASGSLGTRPMGMLEGPLRALGARCSTNDGLAPVRVRGPLVGGHAIVDASTTSQVLTGLLFALPRCDRDSELELCGLASGGYVELSLEVLASFGIRIDRDADARILRIPGAQHFVPREYVVEGDWSAAAFLLVAAAIAGEVEVTGLRGDSRQPDARVLEVLRQCGAVVDLTNGVRVSAADSRAFRWDVSDTPDLLPPLVALACACRGTSEISGIGRTRAKESDRVAALCDALGRLGAAIEVSGERLHVTGSRLHGGTVDSHGDHRIAMAVAIAALRASAPVHLAGARCVDKSYPRFFEDLEALHS